MSYYADVVKPRQKANAYDMAKEGSPEGACFVPDKPVTYCCTGTNAWNFVLFLRTWAGSGRCMRRSITPSAAERESNSPTVAFDIDGDKYLVLIRDYSVWHAGSMPVAVLENFECQAKAGIFFKGTDAKLARSLQKGSNQAAVSRNYYRKKRIALAHYLPAKYMPLPSETIAAYYRVGNRFAVVQPTTRALDLKLPKGDDAALKLTMHPEINGSVFVFGEEFLAAGDTLVVKALVKYNPMNLPDQAGFAEIVGTRAHVHVTTPRAPKAYVDLEGDEFTFNAKRYKFSAKGIVLA